MKRSFLIVILFWLANGVYAQESNRLNYLSGSNPSVATKFDLNLVTPQSYEPYINESKQWRYVQELYLTDEAGGANYLVNLVYFKGDTIVDNITYSKLYRKSEQPIPQKTYLAYMMREDAVNQKVFVYDPHFNQTALLFDFTLNKGDEFNIYLLGDLYSKHTVVKVDTITDV